MCLTAAEADVHFQHFAFYKPVRDEVIEFGAGKTVDTHNVSVFNGLCRL